MNLRNLGVCMAAVAAAIAAQQFARADGSLPSEQTLAAMGLGGMTIVTDEDAMRVRGHGFKGGGSSVAVFGNSFATISSKFGTAHSENGYAAEGSKFASGKNFSEAGVEIKTTHGRKVGKFRKPVNGNHAGKVPHGNFGRKMGGHHDGGKHLGGTTVRSIRVFAGGFSTAKAF